MPNAKFYKNFITREKRFANRTAFNAASAKPNFNADVVGCFITNTSSYVDIEFNVQEDAKILNSFSYIIFDNILNSYSYCAFIDRVEPNNFNFQNEYEAFAYRIFITVDWWSTIMMNDLNEIEIPAIKSSLEGNVERAHINDVVKVNNVFKADLSNTLIEGEFSVNRYIKTSKNIFQKTNDYIAGTPTEGRLRWLYILCNKEYGNPPQVTLKSSTTFICHDKYFTTAHQVYVLPLGDPDIIKTQFNVRYKFAGRDDKVFNIGGVIRPDGLTDSSIYAMFISDYCPFYKGDGFIEIDWGVISDEAYANFGFGDLAQIYDTTKSAIKLPKNVKAFSVNANQFNVTTKGNLSITKPENYNDYIENNIIKSKFYPYTFNTILKGEVELPLDEEYIDNSLDLLFEINMDGLGSSYIIYSYSPLLVGEDKYISLVDRGAFPTSKQDDFFTRANAWNTQIQALGKTSFGLLSSVGSVLTQNRGSLVSQAMGSFHDVNNLITAGINYARLKRDGENGTKILPNSYSNYLDVVRIIKREPYKVDKASLLKDLALYGYNTFLHPHVVLEDHKRKYFNYIKCNNAKVLANNYNTEIRLQIEEMFNNGVWLWNTSDKFGEFEVPNYPIIMDE